MIQDPCGIGREEAVFRGGNGMTFLRMPDTLPRFATTQWADRGSCQTVATVGAPAPNVALTVSLPSHTPPGPEKSPTGAPGRRISAKVARHPGGKAAWRERVEIPEGAGRF